MQGVTRSEIDRRWQTCYLNEKHELRFPERKLYRYLREIEYVFGVEVVCQRKGEGFSPRFCLKDSSESSALNRWVMGHLSMQQSLGEAGDVSNYVLYEEVPEGALYLSSIVGAMRRRHCLRMQYHKFGSETEELTLAPYCLRMFKQRWYVVGVPSTHPEEIRTYALDRVEAIEETDDVYQRPVRWSPYSYFRDYYGMFHSGRPCKVRLRTSARSAAYLRSLPLHHSQEEVEREDEYSVFVYKLAPTLDFIQELRTHGAQLEVLAPRWLREQMAGEARAIAALYK